jgi:hypothetical protein
MSIIMALIGFLVKRVYDKIDELEKTSIVHGKALTRIEALLEK